MTFFVSISSLPQVLASTQMVKNDVARQPDKAVQFVLRHHLVRERRSNSSPPISSLYPLRVIMVPLLPDPGFTIGTQPLGVIDQSTTPSQNDLPSGHLLFQMSCFEKSRYLS